MLQGLQGNANKNKEKSAGNENPAQLPSSQHPNTLISSPYSAIVDYAWGCNVGDGIPGRAEL